MKNNKIKKIKTNAPKYTTQRKIIEMYLNTYGNTNQYPILLPFPVTPNVQIEEKSYNSKTEVFTISISDHRHQKESYPLNLDTLTSKLNFPRKDSSFPSAAMFLYDDNGPISANVSKSGVNLSGIKHKLQILKIVLQLQLDFYKSGLPVPYFFASKSMINTTLVFTLPFSVLEEQVNLIAPCGFKSCYNFNSNQFSTTITSIQVYANSNFPFSEKYPKEKIVSKEQSVFSSRVSKNNINMCGGNEALLSMLLAEFLKQAIANSPHRDRIVIEEIPSSDIEFKSI
jgi:hypothetical protein